MYIASRPNLARPNWRPLKMSISATFHHSRPLRFNVPSFPRGKIQLVKLHCSFRILSAPVFRLFSSPSTLSSRPNSRSLIQTSSYSYNMDRKTASAITSGLSTDHAIRTDPVYARINRCGLYNHSVATERLRAPSHPVYTWITRYAQIQTSSYS